MTDETKAMEVYQPAPKAMEQATPQGVALAAQAKAMVEARYLIALRQPRDLDVVRSKLLKECARPSFAATARYNKPVGKGIVGPSIRFAEACFQAMGNVLIECPTISDDTEKRVMRVTVTDLESNVSASADVTVLKTVERSKVRDGDTVLRQRTNSKGQPVFVLEATDDDILNKQNALVSKALRTQGLRLVPKWLIDECMDAVVKTQHDEAAKDPDAARRAIFDAFASVGVDAAALKKHLGHEGVRLSPQEVTDLRGLYAALRDGETSWREVEAGSQGEGEAAPTRSAATKLAETLQKAPGRAKGKGEGESHPTPPNPASPAGPDAPEPGSRG